MERSPCATLVPPWDVRGLELAPQQHSEIVQLLVHHICCGRMSAQSQNHHMQIGSPGNTNLLNFASNIFNYLAFAELKLIFIVASN